ncbi:MAG: hypothetical protein HZA54_09785 [Planctomycetes bacterium]|nr:hypothetical protein [Planctomycetota bacterium]
MDRPDPPPGEVRRFGLTLLGGFGLLGALLWYLGSPAGAGADPVWCGRGRQVAACLAWGCGTAALFVCLVAPARGRRLQRAWMAAGTAVGEVMTRVLLTFLYFVLLPPFALLRWWDPLRLRLEPSRPSYWEDISSPESTLERARRPF